jgi:tripartite-type tricarboxylate transporter receptor subunit TctC
MTRVRGALTALFLSTASLLGTGAFAADAPFPSGPITLIVPNPPGGASDIVARVLSTQWPEALKESVVILNRPGVGGAVGTAQAGRAKPDGLTVLLAQSAFVVSPDAERTQGRKPLYAVDQFEPIALLTNEPMVVLVRPDAPWKTLNDLIAAAKAKPGTINYASSGNFGPIHLSVQMLISATGVNLTQVPFGGGGPAVLAVLGNQVQFTAAAPSVAQGQIESGKLRPLASSGAQRSEMLPNVPTYKELGYDAQFSIWAGLYVPKGVPAPVMKVLRESIAQTVQTPEYKAAMQKNGIATDYRDAPAFAKFADEDGRRMVKVIRAMGKIE